MAVFVGSVVSGALLESVPRSISDRFVMLEFLGKGATGEVYRAEDLECHRTVALKRLNSELSADPLSRRRFLEEASRASELRHPRIADYFEAVEDNRDLYLVMEYVEGETLRQRLKRPLARTEFFRIATQCAEALVAAHAGNLVHCDIKPENIMLTPQGDVKVLDFGVAKRLQTEALDTTVDRKGTLSGTPAYMAPEVLRQQKPDARADIFSMAVVLYEMLTRQHPFLAESFVETTNRISNHLPESPRELNPEVSKNLERVVRTGLAKDPRERYASAQELLDDLRAVEKGRKPRNARWVPAHDTEKRNPWLTAVAVIAVIAAGVLVRQKLFSKPVLIERGWVLISDFDTQANAPLPDSGIREGLSIALQQSRYVNVFTRSRVYDVLQRMKKSDVTRIDESLGREVCQRENLQVLLAGSIEEIGSQVQITVRAVEPVHGTLLFAEKEQFDRKDQVFGKVDELARRVRMDLGESWSKIEKTSRPLDKVTTGSLEALQLYSQAKEFMDQGKLEQALPLLQGALQLDPDFAMAHMQLSAYYASIVGKNSRTIEELQKAYDLRLRVTDREQRRIEASFFEAQERYEDTAQALSVLVGLYPDDVDAHSDLSDAYVAIGQWDPAVAELREAVRLDPSSPPANSRLVIRLAHKNAYPEALAAYRAAKARGIESPQLHWGLGLTYQGMGDTVAADAQFRLLQSKGDAYWSLGQLYLARNSLYQGHLAAAESELEAGLLRERQSGNKGLKLSFYDLMGSEDLWRGNRAGARQQADRILDTPGSNLQTVDSMTAGVLYVRSGGLAQAKLVLQRLELVQEQVPSAWNRSSYLNLAGEIALAENQPDRALAAFQAADATYAGVLPHFGMARAYEAKRNWASAVQQWQSVLDARGEVLQEWFPAMLTQAQLQMARSLRQLNQPADARLHYQQALQMWRDSDDTRFRRVVMAELQSLGDAAVKGPGPNQPVARTTAN